MDVKLAKVLKLINDLTKQELMILNQETSESLEIIQNWIKFKRRIWSMEDLLTTMI